jgi:hypothetical protein
MTREELIKAATAGLLRDGISAFGNMGARQMAERVVETVEPLIRADEAERVLGNDYAWVINAALADLRDKIKALPREGYVKGHTTVWLHDVLDLLDGATDG